MSEKTRLSPDKRGALLRRVRDYLLDLDSPFSEDEVDQLFAPSHARQTAWDEVLAALQDILQAERGSRAFEAAMKRGREVAFDPLNHAARDAIEESPPSSERAPDMDELRAKYKAATPEERQRLIHDHDCPRAWEFYHRWSAGSKVCPSCLLCGHQAFDRENWAITHAELPDIYICKGCVDKARAAPSSTDAPFINEHRKILKGYMDSKAAHQTIDWLCDMAIAAPSARKQQA